MQEILKLIKKTVRVQLLAKMPEKHKASFRQHQYETNIVRYIIQSYIVAVMNFLSFCFHSVYYRFTGTSASPYLTMHLVNILIFFLVGIALSGYYQSGYHADSFLDRHIEVLYSAMYFAMEFLMYAVGPFDEGSLIRLAATPFILSCVSIIRQDTSVVLQLVFYLAISLRPLAALINGDFHQAAFLIPIWVIVYPMSLLLSFTVYSWFANAFSAIAEARSAHRQLSRLNERLRNISMHDPLTNLLNRRGFQQQLDKTWEQYTDRSDVASILMIDIDFFKLLNDRYGHLTGDECLIRITGMLSAVLDPDQFVIARYGGEEFIAATYNQPHEKIVTLANTLRAQVLGMRIFNPDSDVAPYVTISIGVATRNITELTHYDTLTRIADECLYYAKRFGRNQIIHTREKNRFENIHGKRLRLPQEGVFEENSLHKALHDVQADSLFYYDGRLGEMHFTPAAAEAYHLPEKLHRPTLEKLMEYIPVIQTDRRVFLRALQSTVDEKKPFFSMEVHLKTEHSKQQIVSIRVNFVYDGQGNLETAYGMMLNVEKLLHYSNYITQHAMTNVITLLPNRLKLSQDLKALLAQQGARGYLLYLDIVKFKEINGQYGHVVGDQVLSEVGVHLSHLVEKSATVYHYGVDQFVIVCNHMDKEQVQRLLCSIQAFFQTFAVSNNIFPISIEFVVTAIEYTANTDPDDLLVDLDIALQIAKDSQGKNCLYFMDAQREEFLTRFNLEKGLKQAVAEGFRGFVLHYQPIIDMHGQKVIGAEALLRWQDKSGALQSPARIIPILEKNGLMPQVEGWIFRRACDDCAQWIQQGAPDSFFVNINLSPQFIGRPSLSEELLSAIEANPGLAMHNITLEVPETAAILELKSTIAMLEKLRKLGCRVAIDDFGTGYSSLSYLQTLPIDEVKIDRSFVLNLDESPNGGEFLSAVVDLAKSMSYLVCVEGVETADHSRILSSTSADFLQGFYFGKPIAAELFYQAFLGKEGNVV